jgi:hypothetical protein
MARGMDGPGANRSQCAVPNRAQPR